MTAFFKRSTAFVMGLSLVTVTLPSPSLYARPRLSERIFSVDQLACSRQALSASPLWFQRLNDRPLLHQLRFLIRRLTTRALPPGKMPVHVSPLAPVRDVLEWREVHNMYQRFLARYHLDPQDDSHVIHPWSFWKVPTLRVVMCYPEHFMIPWSINAHMKPDSQRADRVKAARQWERLVRIYRALGVEILLIRQGPALADQVFMANGPVLHIDGNNHYYAIPPRFTHEVRQGETALYERFFRDLGFTVLDLPGNDPHEGEGDTLPYYDVASGKTYRFGGFGSKDSGYRSNYQAQVWVAETLGQIPVVLEFNNPKVQKGAIADITKDPRLGPDYYHLDTCFFPLGDGRTVLYYPDAFTKEAQELIKKIVAHPIPISAEDAKNFACNSVPVGRFIVTNRMTWSLRWTLWRLGFWVIPNDMSEFLKSGGSVKCCTLLIGILPLLRINPNRPWSLRRPNPATQASA